LESTFGISGQFHFQTHGFRPNNDLETDLYDLFGQFAVTPQLNLQAEYRYRETRHGDLRLRFDPDDFSTDYRRHVGQDTVRGGMRYSLTPYSTVIASLAYSELEEKQHFPGLIFGDDKGYQAEGQYLLQSDYFNVTAGAGTYDVSSKVQSNIIHETSPTKQNDVYTYANLKLPEAVTWTAGLDYVTFDDDALDYQEFNPKLGFQWQMTDWLRWRAAIFRSVKRALVLDQTIEPTQVAGFNQFFDDINGTKVWQQGLGLDARLARNVYGGIEISKRDLKVRLSDQPMNFNDQNEYLYGAYLYWAPVADWASTLEYRFEKLKRDSDLITDAPIAIKTASIPLTISYFNSIGVFADLRLTYVMQNVELSPLSTFDEDSERFFTVDAAIGYRLPARRGIVSLEGANLSDEKFRFENEDIVTSTPSSPRFIPGRTILARLTLNF
jgi:hypothetical protein